MSMLLPLAVSLEDVNSFRQCSPTGHDNHIEVHMSYGHGSCNWEHTLKNAHNQEEFKGYSMESLLRKGVYPIQNRS
eukprot:11001151-Prorocentrum_lima.AAC.1